jgi:hypothetical protein
MTAWTYYPASTLPAPFDVVWCHFPFIENPEQPAPKARPAIVVRTAISDPGFCPEVNVIYGTSVLKMDKRPHDFFVTNFQDKDEAGLYQASRFDLDKILWLPWAKEFFVSPGRLYPTPVMGSLPDHLRRILAFMLIERRDKKRREKEARDSK